MKEKTIRVRLTIVFSLLFVAGLIAYAQLFLFNLDKLSRGGLIDSQEVYAISQGPLVDGPKFKEVDINPRKVSLGDRQQLIVKIEEPDRVALVKAVTELDSSIKEIVLERNENNEWRGEWIVEDTSTKTYRTTFIAVDGNGKENKFTMAWSDPCSGVSLGGSGTLGASCTISGVDGVDNGSLSLNGYTLTIPAGSTFVWNSGYSITANGTIAISGQLKKTYLWIKDADNDGYAPNATDQLAQDSQPSGYQRRYTRSGTTDCNDADGTKWQNLSGYQDSDGDGVTVGSVQSICSGASLAAGWRASPNGSDCNDSNASVWQNLTGYLDGDGDGYGRSTAESVCSGASLASGYVTNGSDCYDSNANARPGQTSYFTVNRGDGSFDYDCNGIQDKEPSLDCTANYLSCSGYILYAGANVTPGFNGSVPSCGSTAAWYGLVELHENASCTHWNAGTRPELTSCGQSYNCPWNNPCINLQLGTKQVTCR